VIDSPTGYDVDRRHADDAHHGHRPRVASPIAVTETASVVVTQRDAQQTMEGDGNWSSANMEWKGLRRRDGGRETGARAEGRPCDVYNGSEVSTVGLTIDTMTGMATATTRCRRVVVVCTGTAES
jgi:hypothetical protein